ncbi:unnamed protein product, partial [Effrenium voratum]
MEERKAPAPASWLGPLVLATSLMEAELQQLATLLEVEAEKLAPLSSKQDAWVKALRQLAEQAVRSGIDY